MRTPTFLAAIFTSCLLAASTFAQEAGVFDRLDKNGDGEVTADEVGDDAKGLFERLLRNNDENKDGKLSKAEFGAAVERRPNRDRPDRPRRERPGFDPGAMFDRADRNGDGKLTKDELPERLAERFERLDANSDGSVDKEELRRGFAAAVPRLGGPGEPRPEMAVGAMVLRALDADGDGEISASEIEDAPKALAKFDKNGDGKLDKEELLSQAPRPEGRPGAEAFAARLKDADKNGDGKLSKEEAPERLRQVFDRIDANSDGEIDADEMRRFLPRRPE